MTNVAAIVLAAGESSRMGRPKPLLPLGAETFLGHLLSQLRQSQVTQTIIVLGHHPEIVLQAMPEIESSVVVNSEYHLGQLSSLQCGLRTLSPSVDAALMCLADHPFIPCQVIDAMIDAFERTAAPIVIPTFGGRRGHPTLFARALFDELLSAPLDQGARVVVRAHAAEIHELVVEEASILADIDTPADYQEWLARWSTRA